MLDIETAALRAYAWGLFDQNIGLNQIECDWHIISWAAKWIDKPKLFYMDQRHEKNVENDKKILKGIWNLMDEADVIVSQNGKAFDIKKLNARFVIHGMPPPSPFQQIDTRILAKRHFAFTSTKLEYLSDKLCKHKKMKTKEFQGFDLWKECLRGNIRAWNELKLYNCRDVIATEELYKRLAPWGTSVNLNVFDSVEQFRCKECGSKNVSRNGTRSNRTGKYARFVCRDCHAWGHTEGAKHNLMTKGKKASLKGP